MFRKYFYVDKLIGTRIFHECVPALLIFINHMPQAVSPLALLFADDTTFQHCNSDLSAPIKETESQLETAATWFSSNKLSLNLSKIILYKKFPLGDMVLPLPTHITQIPIQALAFVAFPFCK